MNHSTMMEVLTEIQKITQSSNPYKTAITAGLSGSIKVGSGLRSLYWRIYLGLLSVPRSKPRDSSEILEQWEDEIHTLRKQFTLGGSAKSAPPDAVKNSDQTLPSTPPAAPPKKKSRFGGSDSDDDDQAAVSSSGDGQAHLTVLKDNPLSSDKESSYAKAFQRKKLEEIIDKDLGRLWSDDPFFESDLVHDTLRAILLEFCDEDRADQQDGHIPGYRQGMHEVLSLIMFVVNRDADLIHSLKPKLDDLSEDQEGDWSILQALFSPAAVAQDTYMIFSRLMSLGNGIGLVSWYHGGPTGSPSASSPVSPQGSSQTNIVVDVANDVQIVLLKAADESLWKTMNKVHDIQATSYLLRWLRLLFLREFPFHQVMQLWDAVFAEYSWRVSEEDESSTYTLADSIVPYISLSMLLFISEDLQNSNHDYSFAMRRLMRYPPVEDVRPIIRKAIERRHRGSRLALIAGLLVSGPASVASATLSPSGAANADPLPQEVTLTPCGALLPPPSSTVPGVSMGTVSTRPPPPLSAAFGTAVTPTAVPSRNATFTPETTASLRDKQIRQGMALASIVRRMETRWFPPSEQTADEKAAAEEDYLVAIAELKRVRDVLLGSLAE
eukprot:CAMPEP_0176413074 /NCGR_PEP_ID=MMETSP0127-20121128/4493_1 /TAXON_ID=938130 /ORGANISM="Platyophrya macrostoma, Strain WH" /LENGTH=608 /DNA_ID=CAMNT_0017792807 /DNA_START=42 /DNA_END=1868 /DNA_ORIENTATION=+